MKGAIVILREGETLTAALLCASKIPTETGWSEVPAYILLNSKQITGILYDEIELDMPKYSIANKLASRVFNDRLKEEGSKLRVECRAHRYIGEEEFYVWLFKFINYDRIGGKNRIGLLDI